MISTNYVLSQDTIVRKESSWIHWEGFRLLLGAFSTNKRIFRTDSWLRVIKDVHKTHFFMVVMRMTSVYCRQLATCIINNFFLRITCDVSLYLLIYIEGILTCIYGSWYFTGIIEAPDHNSISRINGKSIQGWRFQWIIRLREERIPPSDFSYLSILIVFLFFL